MNYKKLGVVLVLLLIAAAGSVFYLRQELAGTAHDAADITDLSENYKADAEIQQARQSLENGSEAAQVITALPDGNNRVAIVFEGLPDRPTTARLLDLLKKYHATAVFFVEGQNAADQPETIKLIREAGQEIGDYTFVGISQAEKLSSDELLAQLCQTQKVLSVQTGKAPSLFMAPRTSYTTGLLQTVRACGIEYAVKSNVQVKRNTLHTLADADALAAKIKPGSIISVQTGTPVQVKSMEEGKTDERPAIDKKPTVGMEGQVSNVQREDIVDEVERLLLALQSCNVQTDFVDSFRKIDFALKPSVSSSESVDVNKQSESGGE